MKKTSARWQLAVYDAVVLFVVDLLQLAFYRSNEELSLNGVLLHASIGFVCIFAARFVGQIYRQIWRDGGIQCYIRLLVVDGIAFIAIAVIEMTLRMFVPSEQVTFSRLLSISCMNLLAALAMAGCTLALLLTGGEHREV